MVAQFRKTLRASAIDPVGNLNNYSQMAYGIFEKYLKYEVENLPETINKLIIIPDGSLGYIPFDILLTALPEGKPKSYRNLPYLLKKYSTQYGYSASLLFNDFDRVSTQDASDFIAFAPSYEENGEDSLYNKKLGRFRDQVVALKYNQPEVDRINEYMNGSTYKGPDAMEKVFKNSARDYSVIHLAMHALVDDENPMNSKLVFTQRLDSIEDNFLHAYELYNMEIPADLVVLSACETGFGKLEKGEGVMSLGRAISYAGCPSVVMSHWSVNDAATARLMGYFYKNLANKMSKDEALRQAKLEYLSNSDPAQANPYFWGSFVVMGDVAPIELEKSFSAYFALVGLILVVIAVAIGRKMAAKVS